MLPTKNTNRRTNGKIGVVEFVFRKRYGEVPVHPRTSREVLPLDRQDWRLLGQAGNRDFLPASPQRFSPLLELMSPNRIPS